MIKVYLRDCILKSEFATDKTIVKGNYINGLICPECGEYDAYAYTQAPWSIICNKLNKCGARTKTVPLFNLGTQVEKKYPTTPTDPHRPARAFLESRGIPAEIIDKCGYEYHSSTRKGCGGGVMFPVGDKGKLYNGRLFNPPKGEGKTHNVGAVAGHYWQMPGMSYDPEQPTYVTEGIIDALSLIAMGFQAIAVLGAGYEPAKFDLSAFGVVVLAFDNDKAGARFTKKWFEVLTAEQSENEPALIKVTAIMPPKGSDWNDLLCQSVNSEKATERFNKALPEYEYNARLALANSAVDYANIYFKHTDDKFAPGLFAFQGQYYWSYLKSEGSGENKQVGLITERASNFTLNVEHFQWSVIDEELPVVTYRLKVQPQKGRPVYMMATGDNIKSGDGLTGLFLRHGKCLWLGSVQAAKALAEMIVSSRRPEVRQVAQVGYDHMSGFYVLKDFAIDKKGKKILPSDNGFFNVGKGEQLRPALIETIKPGTCDFPRIYRLLLAAWGENAAVAVAFLVASLFVNQVKKETKFFPFLSLYGVKQTGKSRLIRTLNAMQCLDEEGLPMTQANTKKGELRTLSQVSGCMKALIEGNAGEKFRFDFESFLPLYNYGNPLQVTAMTTNDGRTRSLPFDCTIACVQNVEPFISQAAKERVISLKFSIDDLNDETKAAYDELLTISIQSLAGFYPAVMDGREFFGANWKKQFIKAKDDLKTAIPDNRLNENHALFLAFHRMTCQHFKIEHDLLPFMAQVGQAKMRSVQIKLSTAADHFFDSLQNLPDDIVFFDDGVMTTTQKKTFFEVLGVELYLNRNLAEKAIRDAGFTIDYPERLGKSLQEHPAFIEAGKSHRFPGAKGTVRAMVFDLRKLFPE